MLTGRRELQWEHFFTRLGKFGSGVLALDYDGTLAPFKKDRNAAVPYAGVRASIAAIMASGCTRVVVISGRPVEEVRTLLDLDPMPEIWGSHGLQREWPGGKRESFAIEDAEQDALRKACALLEQLGLASLAETKQGSIAVHVRGLSSGEAENIKEKVRAVWAPLTAGGRMSLLDFDGGIEFRVAAFDKGKAVRTIMNELAEGTPFAFLGDDTTDEDAFRALRGSGALTVLVRTEWRETAADVWICPPAELLEFFQEWLHRSGRR